MGKTAQKFQRSFGEGRIEVKNGVGGTRIDRLFEQGAAKIRLPKTYDGALEAVLINTSGGLTGGDQFHWRVEAKANTNLTVTTQACEKIYQSPGECATINNQIKVGENATLLWLPQETLLFNASSLFRTLHVNLEENARFMALESGMLGRKEMGEQVQSLYFHDRWRVRRSGKLIYADDIRIDGPILSLGSNPALLNGKAAFATLFYSGPEATDTLEAAIHHLQETAANKGIGISAFDGKIIIRMLSQDCYCLRQTLIPVIEFMQKAFTGVAKLPKVWNL